LVYKMLVFVCDYL